MAKKTITIVKRFLLVTFVAIIGFYLYVFVFPKKAKESWQVQLYSAGQDSIEVRLMETYYYIQSIKSKYSENKDTLHLFIYRSTLGNIFANNKLGYKIIEINDNVHVISYCGINVEVNNLKASKAIPVGEVDKPNIDTNLPH